MVTSIDQRRPRLASLLTLGLLVLGCSGTVRQLPPESVSCVRSTLVQSVVPSPKLVVQWHAVNYGGGLAGAIAGHAQNSSAQEAAQAYSDRLLPELSDFDFHDRYWEALKSRVSRAEWLKVSGFETQSEVKSVEPRRDASQLVVGTDFSLLPNLSRLVVSSGFRFVPRSGDGDDVGIGTVSYHSAPIGATEDEAVPLWRAAHGRRMREAIDEGITENTRLMELALEYLAGRKRPGFKTALWVDLVAARGELGIESSASRLEGDVLDVRPERITFRSSDGDFYSLPLSAVERAEPRFVVPPPPAPVASPPAKAAPPSPAAPPTDAAPPAAPPADAAPPAAPPPAAPSEQPSATAP